MVGTPFIGLCDGIMRLWFRQSKCAILALLPHLDVPHCSRDLPQAHLRDVAGCDAERVDGAAGIELADMPETVRINILPCINAASGQKHIRHAVLEGFAVFHVYIEIIQPFKKAALAGVHQVVEVVRHVVLYGVFCRRYEGSGKR
jgi:hypothetical protein